MPRSRTPARTSSRAASRSRWLCVAGPRGAPPSERWSPLFRGLESWSRLFRGLGRQPSLRSPPGVQVGRRRGRCERLVQANGLRDLFVALALFPDRTQRDSEVVVSGGVIRIRRDQWLIEVDRLGPGALEPQDRAVEERRAEDRIYREREPVVALSFDRALGDVRDLTEVEERVLVPGILLERFEVRSGRFV